MQTIWTFEEISIFSNLATILNDPKYFFVLFNSIILGRKLKCDEITMPVNNENVHVDNSTKSYLHIFMTWSHTIIQQIANNKYLNICTTWMSTICATYIISATYYFKWHIRFFYHYMYCIYMYNYIINGSHIRCLVRLHGEFLGS